MSELEMTESDLKRYFPVIFKPIILTLLFFAMIVWIYLTLSAISPNWFINPDPRVTPEIIEKETARAGSLGSFLVNLFQGNFGYSFRTMRPVRDELLWRFPNTCLLIGLSIVLSLLIGMGLSLLFKPDKRKPSTFAHSLRGFFFGLVPVISFPFLLLFCYYAAFALGFTIFPPGGMRSMSPPTDPFAYISDVFWHLSLPVATLALIGVIRILLVLWSSGFTFTKRTLLKRILLPCTTFDFTLIISGVVIVEFVFTWPGIGEWYLTSLVRGDYNALVGAFVMFLVLAVGLGYISVFLDFVQHLTGLRDDLDKKVRKETRINPTQTKESIGKYVKLFLRRKALVVGSAIVIVFLTLAVSAPFITPYDPIGDMFIADDFAKPAWVTLLPKNRYIPPTMELQLNWTVEEKSEFVNVIESGEDVAVQCSGAGTRTQSINFTTFFLYPYDAPNKFRATFTWCTENVVDAEYSLKLSLANPAGNLFDIWTMPFSKENRTLIPVSELRRGADEVGIIFVEKGTQKAPYKLLLQMSFKAISNNGMATIRVEQSKFKIYGLVHGILGTDGEGRDIFSQVVYGARTAVIHAFPIALVAVILGLPFGFLAGYLQSWVDNVITPVIDGLLCLPFPLILLLSIHLFRWPSVSFMLVSLPILLLFLSTLPANAFRNTFLVRPSNQKFKGNSPKKQVLNTFKDLFANFVLTVTSSMLLLWTIDFLVLFDPGVASWGRMLYYAFRQYGLFRLAWWWILPPIVCIALFALGLLLVGAGLEDEGS